ncbi:G3E family GTPase [Desulfobaculum xiamenense]|uniref:G3E family GTPase n=1 Tax=Desulfobaculum xiamenense TaxID=995050 RepID=A0A846QHI9_9BACT|nr:GTP-binding protein [Desulfobaculum xiamenense]NJB66477.1 G3E family GTPase [Desulfobaculum xiamenense]
MNLSAILPPSRTRTEARALPRTLANSLLVACQERPFKRLTGWRGMAPCIGGRGWTCRLAAHPGIYGVSVTDAQDTATGPTARLTLHYFPTPDEDILERMPLAAVLAATQPEYPAAVREFASWPDGAQCFAIASVNLALADNDAALGLSLMAVEHSRVIAEDGVPLPDGDGWLVAPGDAEVDLAERELAMPLFETLAAALSLSLGERPTLFTRTERMEPGRETMTPDGRRFRTMDATIVTDSIVWGDATRLPAEDLCADARSIAHGGPDGELPEDVHKALWWTTHDLAALERAGEHAAAFDMRPRLVVLSGFLGAGKTTFLNQLLEYHASRDEMVAIIQNEIGQTGVDGKLLEGDDSIVELDEGCVCCTLAGSLARGIERLTASFHPEVIVLEATGLANPFNLLDEIGALRHLVRFDSVTTLVDADNAARILDDCDIARNQVRAADILVLNKCDLVDDATRAAIIRRIRELNARAPLVETSHAQVNPALLYDTDPVQIAPSGLLPNMPEQHHGSHADEGFISTRFGFAAPLNRARLVEALVSCPPEVFRIKGILRFADSEEPEVLQYVGGRFELSRLGGAFDDEPFLVAIGRPCDLSVLSALSDTCEGDAA